MPEPTTADPIDTLRDKVSKWAPQGVSDVMCSLADIAVLLAAYDQQARDLDAFGHAISDQSRRAQEAENRAAAAEARASAAQRDAAKHRRAAVDLAGQLAAAEAAVQRVRALIEAQGPDSYVMSHALLGAFTDSVPLVCGCGIAPEGAPGWGGGCSPQCMSPVPAGDAILPVSTVLNLGDDEDVTVEGAVAHCEPRVNRSGAAYITVTLADLRDPEITARVDIHAGVYQRLAADEVLHEGTVVLVRGLTQQRTSLLCHGLRPLSDWGGDTDPAVYAADPPAFTPLAASQFRAGLAQAHRDIEDGAR